MMKTSNTTSIEYLSAFALFMISMVLIKANINNFVSTHSFYWVFSLLVISATQFISVKFELIPLRICMTWVVGIIWTWLSFATLNNTLSMIAMCIGSFNIYAFVVLVNRVNFDWVNFIKE